MIAIEKSQNPERVKSTNADTETFRENVLDLMHNQQDLVMKTIFNRRKEARVFREDRKFASKISNMYQKIIGKVSFEKLVYKLDICEEAVDESLKELKIVDGNYEQKLIFMDNIYKRTEEDRYGIDSDHRRAFRLNIDFLKDYQENKENYASWKKEKPSSKEAKDKHYNRFNALNSSFEEMAKTCQNNQIRIRKPKMLESEKKAGQKRPAIMMLME